MIQKTVTQDQFDATILNMVYSLGLLSNVVPNAESIEKSKQAAKDLGIKVIENRR